MTARASAASALRTVSAKIILLLIVTLTGITAILGVYSYMTERRSLYTGLETTDRRLVERLSFVVRDPLWFFDLGTLEQLIDFEMSDPDITSIRILDEKKELLLVGRTRDLETKELLASTDSDPFEAPPAGVHARYVSEIRKDDATIGFLYVDVTDASVQAALLTTLRRLVIELGVLAVILGFVIFASVTSIVIIRVRTLHEHVDRLSTGDLTHSTELSGNDEIAALGTGIARLVDRLRAMLGTLKRVSDTNAEQGQDIAANLEEVAATAGEIDGSMNRAVEQTGRLSAEVESAGIASRQIHDRIRELASAAESQRSAMLDAVSGVRTMLDRLAEVSNRAGSRLEGLRGLDTSAARGASEMQTTRGAIREIAESVNSILEVIGVIDEVASRSNILAMNAAIEAAHAGASGRGFAVVADEVRNLASITAQNSRDIADRVERVVAEMEHSEESAGKTERVIASMITEIRGVSDDIRSVLESVEELSGRSVQVDSLLAEAAQLSTNVTEAAARIDEDSSGITQSMEVVRELVTGTLEHIGDTTRAIGDVSSSLDALAGAGAKNSEITRTINDELKRFRT